MPSMNKKRKCINLLQRDGCFSRRNEADAVHKKEKKAHRAIVLEGNGPR